MEILRRVLDILGGFAIELAKLFPIMLWLLKFRLQSSKRIFIWSASATVILIVMAITGVSQIIPVHTYICILFVILIFKGKFKILYTAVAYMGVCIIDMLTAAVWLTLSGTDYEALASNEHFSMIINSISIAVVAVLVIASKLSPLESQSFIPDKGNCGYLILLLVGELSLLDFITIFLVSAENEERSMAVSLSIGSVMFLLIGVIMFRNYISKNHYKNIYEINEKLIKSQEQYYSMLLKKDEETKKFRHDIIGHINCMYLLFKEKNYDELENYFKKMGASLSEIKVKIQTGNNMINAILSDVSSKFSEVSLNINGSLPNSLKLSNADICTIFYNLFDNAFAAAEQSDEKRVDMFIKMLGSNLYISVLNTVQHKVEISDNSLITEKRDKLHHGYGTVNAKNCAEQNNGSLVFNCTDNIFEAELIIPNAEKV